VQSRRGPRGGHRGAGLMGGTEARPRDHGSRVARRRGRGAGAAARAWSRAQWRGRGVGAAARAWRKRGRREGMRGRRMLVVFWSINFKKHIEEVSSGVFRRAEKL
jgi:hypothetical protein